MLPEDGEGYLNEIFCPRCGEKVCEFVTYCPNCGFDVQSYRKKSREQQISAYFRNLYSHAPKNDAGFARSEGDGEAPGPWSDPGAKGNAAGPVGVDLYGDGFYSGAGGSGARKKTHQPGKNARLALIITLAVALPCIAAAVVFLAVFGNRNDQQVFVPETSEGSESEIGTYMSLGTVRYIDISQVRCTVTSDNYSHLIAVVGSGFSGNNELHYVSVEDGIGEYLGPPEITLLGYAECDDSIAMSSISTNYRYINVADSYAPDCRVEFDIEFNADVDGLFVYDVDFSDGRMSCRCEAVSVSAGKCKVVVNCSDVEIRDRFTATLVPRGFVPSETSLEVMYNTGESDVSFSDYYFYSRADVRYELHIQRPDDTANSSLYLYSYQAVSGGELSQINQKKYRCAYSLRVNDSFDEVRIRFTDICYGMGLERPEYEVQIFGKIPIKEATRKL